MEQTTNAFCFKKSKENIVQKDDLQKLQIKQLWNVTKEHNIKVTLKMKKAEITESIWKTQDFVFQNIVAHELNFHDDIKTPARGERKAAYIILEKKKSRFIKKFNATEVDYTIKIKKLWK